MHFVFRIMESSAGGVKKNPVVALIYTFAHTIEIKVYLTNRKRTSKQVNIDICSCMYVRDIKAHLRISYA